MNIGVLHTAAPEEGGAYQYSENVIKCLKKYDDTNNYILFYTQENYLYHSYESDTWKTVFLEDLDGRQVWMTKKFGHFLRLIPFGFNLKSVCGKYYRIKRYNIDLLYCPTPSLAGYYCQIPYVVTIFDLMQKYYSEFRERPFLSRLKRNFRYKLATKHARLVVAEISIVSQLITPASDISVIN